MGLEGGSSVASSAGSMGSFFLDSGIKSLKSASELLFEAPGAVVTRLPSSFMTLPASSVEEFAIQTAQLRVAQTAVGTSNNLPSKSGSNYLYYGFYY